MTYKEACEIMQEVKKYMTAGNPIWDVKKMEEAFDRALVALTYFAYAEQLSDEISDKCQNALGEKWVEERKES